MRSLNAVLVLSLLLAQPLYPSEVSGGNEPGSDLDLFMGQEVSDEAVSIDVVVTNDNGHPVRGLLAEDFEVRIDGESMPITNFLAIDVHSPGVGSLLKQIDEQQLKNVRIIQHDAVEVVRDMIPAVSLHAIHVFFPDPWPKKRHHKRRLLQVDFVSELATRLEPGGYLHIATDWQEYAEQILQVLSAEPLLANTAESYSVRPAYRPRTKFEERGLKLGHDVWDIIFRRR